MKRPTCGTCPYWDSRNYHEGGGLCRRFPPVFAANDRLSQEAKGIVDPWEGIQPISQGSAWCGEHPDFPAYLESLKRERSTPAKPHL